MDTIRLVSEIAALRSFSQAAARHGITQSAVSQRIGQLERRLGVKLVDRSVRPLALTEAGEEFARGCREMTERYDDLLRRVARLKGDLHGLVRVDAIYSAGIDLLNRIRDEFVRLHPRVRLVVEYQRPEQVYDTVLNHRCDLGILSYPRRWRQVGCVPLRNERMVVVTVPGHPLADRSSVQAAQLADWPMIGFEPEMPVAQAIKRYLKQHGVAPRLTSVFDNIDTIKSALAVARQELAVLPKRTVVREVRAGTLAAVELAPVLVRPMGVIYPRPQHAGGRPFTPAAQAFVDYLLQQAGPKVDLDAELENVRARQLVSV